MSVVKINLSDIKKIDMINTKGMTGNKVLQQYNPDCLINLALYDMATKLNIVHMEDENVQTGYLFAENGIGIEDENKIMWIAKEVAYKNIKIRDFVAGAPTLVINGAKNISWGNKVSSQIQGKHNRTAIGFNNEQLILYTSDDSITLDTLANRMIAYGCKYAINCDGGGSSYLQNQGNVLKYSYRNNASWFLVYLKKKEEFEVYKYLNNSNKSQPVYETTECKKKIGSLDPYETCECLYEMPGYKVVLYNITGKTIKKVGFIKE